MHRNTQFPFALFLAHSMMDCILHQRLQDQFQHQNIQQIFIHFIFNADFIIIPDIDDRHVTFDNIQFFPHRDHLTSTV